MPEYTWEPEKVVFVDLETQSSADIKAVGSRAYLRHSSTRLMSGVALIGDRLLTWVPHGVGPSNLETLDPRCLLPEGCDKQAFLAVVDGIPEPLARAIRDGYTFVAHNAAGFDALAWEKFYPGPQPTWYDTIPCARAAGYPAGLDAIGEVLTGTGKDKNGQKAMHLLCEAKVTGSGVRYNVGTLPLWRDMLSYNVQDVLLLEKVYEATLEYGESDVMVLDAAINDRGIAFDRRYLETLQDLWQEAVNSAIAQVSALTGEKLTEANIRSVPQVKKWLLDQGLKVESLNRQDMERMYADPEAFFGEIPENTDIERVVEVLKLRQSAVRITRAKLQRLAAMADADDRVRGMLVYWGAHTGRWSGRGFQPHNLARGVSDLDVEAVIRGVMDPATEDRLGVIRAEAAKCKGNVSLDAAMTTLLRPVFCAPPGGALLTIDYAQVESRGVAWCAGEESLLDVFADPSKDSYCAMAGKVFGKPITKADTFERFIGKTLVLGAGYSLSANKFAFYCKNAGIDLAAAGVTAEECIEAYRDACPNIAGVKQGEWRRGGLWRAYGDAALKAVRSGTPQDAGRCTFTMVDNCLRVYLPSGRFLTYREARVEDVVPKYAIAMGLPLKPKPTVVYRHPHGYDGSLYGGLITENVVQAICRDLLACAMLSLDGLGFKVVMHVHDEVVVEWPSVEDAGDALKVMATVMSTPPEFARSFPLAVEGHSCERYVKSPWGTSHKVKALGGRLL